MRSPVDAGKIHRFLELLGTRSRGPGRVYLAGGATALLEGWRSSTADVDLKLDPEPGGAFEAIADLKDELDLNVELASPDDFIPAPPGWRDRSRFIARHGEVDFFHYDLRGQALSKLARSHDRDLDDVQAMIDRGLVTLDEITDTFREIEPQMVRYPGLDAAAFAERVAEFVREARDRDR